MKLTLEAQEFREAVKTVAVLFDAETNILVTADEDDEVLVLEAGNGGSYIKQTIPAEIDEGGVTVLSCQHVMPLRLKDTVEIEADDNQLQFKAGRFRGSIAAGGDKSLILDQRPVKTFRADTELPAEVLKGAVGRVSFGHALPGSQVGIRIQAGEELVVSTTDQFRATIYRDELSLIQDPFDILLQPAFIQTLLGRVSEFEVGIGAYKGTFKLKTSRIEMYHPAIQQVPEDIDDWIKNGIDYDERRCVVQTTAEEITEALIEVTSIRAGSLDFDTYVDLMIKGKKLAFRCVADHGSSKTHMLVEESDAGKHQTKLSSRYTLEMLNLIKAGDIEIGFWDDFILVSGFSGKFKGILPTVA